MQPFSGNQHPGLLTSLMKMFLASRLPRETHLCGSSSNVTRLPSFLEMPLNFHALLTCGRVRLRHVLGASTACAFSRSQLRKVVRDRQLLRLSTSQSASGRTTARNCSSPICPDSSAPAALASLLFDPPEPQIIGKTQCFATFLPFRAPGSSFF